MRVNGNANYNGNVNAFDQYFGQQSFRFNIRYNFNKGEKFQIKQRQKGLEKLQRAS